ncbi:MAG: GCG_CRPN prefix-to-repeats domain-containing protein [Beijerinckiaceae bacterium]
MKRLSAALLGVVIISTALSSAVTPAFALGGCGPNFHRNGAGQCVWGGQNQAWCLRHTGHPAVRAPNGEMICYR